MNDKIKAVIESAEVNKMLSASRLLNLYHLLSQCLVFGVPGEIVEVGCNTGWSARFIRMVMDHHRCCRTFHVYDSFEGLSAPTEGDATPENIGKGYLKSKEEELVSKFEYFGLKTPHIHKGWVQDILPRELPGNICFAHIDVDLYQPIKDSLVAIYPRLSHNGIMVVDDYGHPDWPGTKRAVDEFAMKTPEQLNDLDFQKHLPAQYQAFFRKKFVRHIPRKAICS